jgi:DNA-binding NarL/FixJ family response regulator
VHNAKDCSLLPRCDEDREAVSERAADVCSSEGVQLVSITAAYAARFCNMSRAGPNDFGESADVFERYTTRLTARQRQVLQLVVQGCKTKEIARQLGVSIKTIELHRAQLMKALSIRDIPGLVRFAIRLGLLSLN